MDEKPNCFKVLIKTREGKLISLYMQGENVVAYKEGEQSYGIDGTPLFAFYDKNEAMSLAQNFYPGVNTVVYSAIGEEKVKRPPYLLKLTYARNSISAFINYWKDPMLLKDRVFHTSFVPFTILYKSIRIVEKLYERYPDK